MLVESGVGLSLMRRMGVFVLIIEVMFWIACGILAAAISSVVAAAVAVDVVDEVVSALPSLWSSPVSARAMVMRREDASMAVPTVY